MSVSWYRHFLCGGFVDGLPELQQLPEVRLHLLRVQAAPLEHFPEISLRRPVHFPVHHAKVKAGDKIGRVQRRQGVGGLPVKMPPVAFLDFGADGGLLLIEGLYRKG